MRPTISDLLDARAVERRRVTVETRFWWLVHRLSAAALALVVASILVEIGGKAIQQAALDANTIHPAQGW